MCGSGPLGAVSSWFGSPWDTARSRCGHGPGGLDEVAGQAFCGEGEALGALEAVPREADCSEDHGGGQSAVTEGRCLDMRRSLRGRHEARSQWSAWMLMWQDLGCGGGLLARGDASDGMKGCAGGRSGGVSAEEGFRRASPGLREGSSPGGRGVGSHRPPPAVTGPGT